MYRRPFKKNFHVDPSKAGIIIGSKGAGIKSLQGMPNVIRVNLDTRSSQKIHYLNVTAVNEEACDAVFREVQKRIVPDGTRFPEISRIFLDEPDQSLGSMVLIPCQGKGEEIVYKESKNLAYTHFKLYKMEEMDLDQMFESQNLDSNATDNNVKFGQLNRFEEMNSVSMTKVLEDALKLSTSSLKTNGKLEFSISPGKLAFVGPSHHRHLNLIRSKMTGSDQKRYMANKKIKPLFSPYLNSHYAAHLRLSLARNGFELLNENSPLSYTTVHLYAGKENAFFSVVLALDENMEELTNGKEDMRLTKEKKDAVDHVLKARTIGEVMGGQASSTTKSWKVLYKKQSLILHPDKNAHPGATEAFKKLQHAKDMLSEGKPETTEAIKVETHFESTGVKKPPKVISVKTEKKKLCSITLLSTKKVDLRARLVTYAEDIPGLSDHVRRVLNSCWEKREANGDIPTPEGQTGVHILSMKQVKAEWHWIKEEEDDLVMEIVVKEIREKSEDGKWGDCVEVDIKMASPNGDLSANNLSKLVEFIKEKYAKIFCCIKI